MGHRRWTCPAARKKSIWRRPTLTRSRSTAAPNSAPARCSARGRRLERNPQPHACRRGEPFECACRRLHPSAFETRDHRLRRVHALGQLLLGENPPIPPLFCAPDSVRRTVRSRRAATGAVNRSRTWRNSPGGRNPYSKRPGSAADTGRRSGPGHTKRLISLTTIHDRASSRPSRRLTAGGISTVSSGRCGGLCVTGTTATTVSPPSSWAESTQGCTAGLSGLPPAPHPPRCSIGTHRR